MSVPTDQVRNPSDERAIADGCYYDPAAGERVAQFCRRFLRHSIGRFARQPFELLDWQRELVNRQYGWKRPDGTRRFRESYLEVPKKNGKSTLTAAKELYHLTADGESAPEVYTGAKDRQQSGIIFKEVSRMIRGSPELRSRLEVISSAKRVVYAANNGTLQALSADVGSKEGLNASYVGLDELHAHPKPDLYYTLRYAGAAREQPFVETITTAGHDRESICYQLHETARQIADGTKIETNFLGVIYAADEGDDFEDPAVWRKANPSLGHTIRLDDFAADARAAKRSPGDWNQFLRYRLNLWLNVARRFVDRARWDRCGGPVDPVALVGQPCWAGLDLASTTDLAALALLFPCGSLIMRFWTPGDTLDERSRRDHVNYRAWVDAGHLTATPGASIDYGAIRREILALAAAYKVSLLCCDEWNATQLAQELIAAGLPVKFLRQGFASLTAPTKELERMVLARELRHGSNPVLNWNADNAAVTHGENEAVKLSKRMSRQRIDGMAAIVDAIAAKLASPPAPDWTGGLTYF